jgi:protein-tyrosine phosphatase
MGLLNFRDLGGMKAACGKTVRAKRLLRAAQPVGLSLDEKNILREHDLKFIVDFRTQNEVATLPVDEISGVTYSHIDIMGENAAQAAAPEYWMSLFNADPASVPAEFTKTYREFATSASSRAGYGAFVKSCAASASGATLFHCTAGKDRTGFAAAIILKLLGVPAESIFADYLKTREFQDQIHYIYVKKAIERGISSEQVELMRTVFDLRESYLQAAFNAAYAAFGNFENYVREGLGIYNEEIESLKNFYLE